MADSKILVAGGVVEIVVVVVVVDAVEAAVLDRYDHTSRTSRLVVDVLPSRCAVVRTSYAGVRNQWHQIGRSC